jgi:hypothetical protein
MVFPDSGSKTIRVLSSSLKVNIKPEYDEVFQLNAPADRLFVKNPGLDTCFQEPVDPDPEIIFQDDIHRGSVIFEYEKIAIPPYPFEEFLIRKKLQAKAILKEVVFSFRNAIKFGDFLFSEDAFVADVGKFCRAQAQVE